MSPLKIHIRYRAFSTADKIIPAPFWGWYRIPCSFGCFYVGRTQQELGERLSEHRSSIDKAMGLRQRSEIFYSVLAQHLYDNPHYSILFNNTSIIALVNVLMLVFREAIEIKKKHIHGKVSLNRDTRATFFSPNYDEIINSNRFYLHPQNYFVQSNRIPDNNLHGK